MKTIPLFLLSLFLVGTVSIGSALQGYDIQGYNISALHVIRMPKQVLPKTGDNCDRVLAVAAAASGTILGGVAVRCFYTKRKGEKT